TEALGALHVAMDQPALVRGVDLPDSVRRGQRRGEARPRCCGLFVFRTNSNSAERLTRTACVNILDEERPERSAQNAHFSRKRWRRLGKTPTTGSHVAGRRTSAAGGPCRGQ